MKTLREYIDLVEGKWFDKQPDTSFIPDEVYNKISAYVKQNFPHHEISGLGRNDKGQIKFQVYDPKSNQHVTNLVWTGDLAEEVKEDEESNLQPGTPIMVWLGPPTNNPPRDDKKYWAKGEVVDTPEWDGRRWLVLVKTDKTGQNPISPDRVFLLKQQGLEEDAADDVTRLAKEMRK